MGLLRAAGNRAEFGNVNGVVPGVVCCGCQSWRCYIGANVKEAG